MQILHNWHIIYLTGKPIDRCRLSTPAKNQSKITVNFSQELDGYFLCLKLLTSVTIAHIIITNVNKSEYVTMSQPPFRFVGGLKKTFSLRIARWEPPACRLSVAPQPVYHTSAKLQALSDVQKIKRFICLKSFLTPNPINSTIDNWNSYSRLSGAGEPFGGLTYSFRAAGNHPIL